jgi:hypothetical protein
MQLLKLILATTLLAIILGCDTTDDPSSSSNNTTEIPDVYSKIYGATDMYIDGNYLVIKSNGRPDHKSPYYQNTTWSSTLYEAYNGSNDLWNQNPNKIGNVNYTFRIPLNPVVSVNHAATPMGPIGVSINGVPFFNQYAAGGVALGDEINSFDQYNGHPAQGSDYHYHIEPLYLTSIKGSNALLGCLLDGFPVYGPIENNAAVTGLDAYHGHSHATTEYPDGIYHYHITSSSPYINGSGFYGTAGTVSK